MLMLLLLYLCLVPSSGLGAPRLRRREMKEEDDEFLSDATHDFGARNDGPCSLVSVSIKLDNHPEQTSWTLSKLGGPIVASSGGTYDSELAGSGVTTLQTYTCLADGCYIFAISDTNGDGMCCSSGNGSFTVSAGGTVFASGGSFAFSESTDFCLGMPSEATTTTTKPEVRTTIKSEVPTTTANPQVMTTTKPEVTTTTVTIIGAGAAGLAASYTLAHHGLVDFVLLEASNDLGGRVQKDTTFTKGAYPLDLGASFVQYPSAIRRIVGRDDILASPPEVGSNFANYTWYDFLKDYIAPKDADRFHYGCRVNRVEYGSGDTVTTTCENGRTVVSQYAIVTVPLPILKERDIDFSPPLPTSMTVNHPGWMWGGFKIFIEFSIGFSSFCFPDIPSAQGQCLNLDGESLFWDVSAINIMLDNGNTIIAGYILGKPSDQFTSLANDDAIAQRVLELMDDRYNGRASQYYVNHMVVNWSKNPDVRGTLSSWGYDRPGTGNPSGAQNVQDKVWVAGEAFPVDGENGWVDAGIFSGDDAAKQILKLSDGIDDNTWFWDKVWQDLGRS